MCILSKYIQEIRSILEDKKIEVVFIEAKTGMGKTRLAREIAAKVSKGFEQKKFDDMLTKVSGKPLSVDTDLNILQDGLGHVFVEISLTFSYGGINEKILVNANEHIIFFRLLAENSMLAIAAKNSPGNIFMIQLPKPERAIAALDIIENGLKTNKN